jgi:hypothetical protein
VIIFVESVSSEDIMSSVYKPVNFAYDLEDGTPLRIILPSGSKEHLIQVTPDTVWRIAFDHQPKLASDQDIEFKAGAAYAIDSPVAKTEIWVQQDSGGTVRLRWAYLNPTFR